MIINDGTSMPKCIEKGMLRVFRDVIIMSACLSSSTKAWVFTIWWPWSSSAPVPWGHCQSGRVPGQLRSRRNRRTWSAWVISRLTFSRWKDLSLDFWASIAKMELVVFSCIPWTSTSISSISSSEEPQPVELHWSIDCFLCQSLTRLECRRPDGRRWCATPNSESVFWVQYFAITTKIHWHLCLTMWNQKCIYSSFWMTKNPAHCEKCVDASMTVFFSTASRHKQTGMLLSLLSILYNLGIHSSHSICENIDIIFEHKNQKDYIPLYGFSLHSGSHHSTNFAN